MSIPETDAKFAPVDPSGVRGRIFETDIIDWRGYRVQSQMDWKRRLTQVDNLYRGDWNEVFEDESIMRENPHVMNMVQTGLIDIAKLVTEASPAVRVPPRGDSDKDLFNSLLLQSIYETYWSMNDGDLLVPRFAMDLAGAGGAFAAVYVDDDSDYPCIHRIDPRYAYPDVINGKMVDLLVVETMNKRIAWRQWPELNIEAAPETVGQWVEIVHYYSAEECVQAVMWTAGGSSSPQAYIVNRWDPQGVNPACMVQLDSFDGQFRGMFDQITGSLQTKNRVVKMLVDYLEEVTYAERFSKGLLNPEETPGPMAHYRLDPTVPDAQVGRVAPAASANQVFQLLDILDREERMGVGYPAARQGEVQQSIASASFVASTQGQLTTTIRDIQTKIAKLRRDINKTAAHVDETWLDKEKPLFKPQGKVKVYKPSESFDKYYTNAVIYGAGAGLDRNNADVRVLQLLGADVISLADAREQVDFITDPVAVGNRVLEQKTEVAMLQKFIEETPSQDLIGVLALQSQGVPLRDAIQKVAQEMQEKMAAAQQAQAPEGAEGEAGLPGPQGPPTAATEQQSLQAGATPPANINFAPPAREDIQVGRTSR